MKSKTKTIDSKQQICIVGLIILLVILLVLLFTV